MLIRTYNSVSYQSEISDTLPTNGSMASCAMIATRRSRIVVIRSRVASSDEALWRRYEEVDKSGACLASEVELTEVGNNRREKLENE